ncbi:MAG TPA: MFS transporter [Anaerolineales bacterium]|nr:MFS transporter [Anaerolineales bacterium]
MNNNRFFPAWLIVLAGTQFGALFVFMNFSGALPLLQNEWQLTNGQAGAIQSAGQVGYLLAVLALSSLTDYIKPKHLIVWGAIWAAVWNLGFVRFAHDANSALLLRVLIGFGIAGIYTPGINMISQQIHTSKRGGAMGFFVASFTLGTAASIAIGGNLSAALGWQTAFSLASIGPIIGALVSWKYLPNEQAAPIKKDTSYSMAKVLQNRDVLLVIFLYMAHAWEVLGLRNWMSAYLTAVRTNAGYSLNEATMTGSSFAGIATVVAAFATASIASISDRVSRTKTIIIVLLLGFVFVFGMGFTLESPWIIVVLVTIIAAFLSNADSAVISTTLTEVVPSGYLGRTLAIYSFLGFLAGSISPYIFGKTLDTAIAFGFGKDISASQPWRWAFFTLAIGSLIGLISAQLLHRRKYPEIPIRDGK